MMCLSDQPAGDRGWNHWQEGAESSEEEEEKGEEGWESIKPWREKWSTYFYYVSRKWKLYLNMKQKLSPAFTKKEWGTQAFCHFYEWPSGENCSQLQVYISGKPGLVKPLLTPAYGLEFMSIVGKGWHFLVKQRNTEVGHRAFQKSPASSPPQSCTYFF